MERIDLSTYVPKSPQQKQLVEYEKLLQQSEKDFESLQNQFEELEKELEETKQAKHKLNNDVQRLTVELNRTIYILNSAHSQLGYYLEAKWIKSKQLQNILNEIKLWKNSKNNS